MDQLDQAHRRQIQKPRFDVIEPSIVRAQFASKRDASFSSYLQPNHSKDHNKTHQDSNPQNKTEDSDQISIFDAAKYFSGLNDDASPRQHGSSKVLDLSSMARLSSVSSSIEINSNYRARSFHATPTASSEASWNSRTGLLVNPPGSLGSSIKSFSPNSSSNDNNNSGSIKNSTRWPRIINPKWLIPPRKCPCSGKKSVQVEERIEAKTPRMVDLRRSPSSIGSKSNASSFYSNRQNSPITSTKPQDPKNRNLGHNKKNPSGFSSLSSNHHPKMIDSLKLVVSHASDTATVTTTNTTSGTSSHGFTFPILEDQPLAVKKMFNVIASDPQQPDPSRDSLEVFQPRSHMSPRSRKASYEEENVSDGSSDLFEIESFSATTYPCRDSMDDEIGARKKFGMIITAQSPPLEENDEPMTPPVAPTECYAPSEVSVDWSVTTAEGFDRASLTNFSVSASEIGYAALRREAEKNGGGGGGRKNGVVNGGGLLMSCRCEKAVSVGPGPIKCSVEGGPEMVARHVGGRSEARQHGQLGATAHVGRSGNGKVGLVVGRPRSSFEPMPFTT